MGRTRATATGARSSPSQRPSATTDVWTPTRMSRTESRSERVKYDDDDFFFFLQSHQSLKTNEFMMTMMHGTYIHTTLSLSF